MNDKVFYRDVSTTIFVWGLLHREKAVVYALRQHKCLELKCIDRDDPGGGCHVRKGPRR